MLYVKVDENNNILEWPLTDLQVRKELPSDLMLPKDLGKLDLRAWGYHQVKTAEPPKPEWLMRVGLGLPELQDDGTWKRTFIQEPKDLEKQWEDVRRRRNNILKDTDWTQIPDNDLTDEEREDYKRWRKYLRNVTTEVANPFDIVWNRVSHEDAKKGKK